MKKNLFLSMLLAVCCAASAQSIDQIHEIIPKLDLQMSVAVRESLGPKVISQEQIVSLNASFGVRPYLQGQKVIHLNDGRICQIKFIANLTLDKMKKAFLEDIVLSPDEDNLEPRYSVICRRNGADADSEDIFISLKRFLYIGSH